MLEKYLQKINFVGFATRNKTFESLTLAIKLCLNLFGSGTGDQLSSAPSITRDFGDHLKASLFGFVSVPVQRNNIISWGPEKPHFDVVQELTWGTQQLWQEVAPSCSRVELAVKLESYHPSFPKCSIWSF